MKTIKQSLQALKEEDHRRAVYAVLVFLMLLTLFFLLVSLEVPDPPVKEEIIEISMDDIEFDLGSQPVGGSQSSDMNPDPEQPITENVIDPAQEIVTQESSDVVVHSSNGSNSSNSTQVVSPPVDNAFTFNGGNGNGQGNGQGDQFGNGTGVGGNGQGNSPGDGTSNPNRKVVKAPSFNSSAQEEGKIALDIYVDAKGNVVKTKFKEGKSTSGSDYLKKLAEKAARTMKYDVKSGAGLEYVGYQVFTFKKA